VREIDPAFRNVVTHQMSLIPPTFHQVIISQRVQCEMKKQVNSTRKSTPNQSGPDKGNSGAPGESHFLFPRNNWHDATRMMIGQLRFPTLTWINDRSWKSCSYQNVLIRPGTAFDMESRHALSYQVKVDPERFPMVDNHAIRKPTGTVSNAEESIVKSTATLGIGLSIQVLGQR
jgi:hypothetical protein